MKCVNKSIWILFDVDFHYVGMFGDLHNLFYEVE